MEIFRYNDVNGNTEVIEFFNKDFKSMKEAIAYSLNRYHAGNCAEVYDDRNPIVILLRTRYFDSNNKEVDSVTDNWISEMIEIE